MKQARLNSHRHSVGLGHLALAILIVLAITWGVPEAMAVRRAKLGTTFKLASPVSVTWLAPVSGSTVSGVVQFAVSASSTVAPISRVEFWDIAPDGSSNLMTVVNGNNQLMPVPPKAVRVASR